MTVSMFARGVPSELKSTTCQQCAGTGMTDEGVCYWCDGTGSTTYIVYPTGLDPVEFSNTSAAAILPLLDHRYNPKDVHGEWHGSQIDVVLLLVRTYMTPELCDSINAPPVTQGRMIFAGRDSAYFLRKLREIEVLLLAAKRAGVSVGYA